jgi:hypothetical protein
MSIYREFKLNQQVFWFDLEAMVESINWHSRPRTILEMLDGRIKVFFKYNVYIVPTPSNAGVLISPINLKVLDYNRTQLSPWGNIRAHAFRGDDPCILTSEEIEIIASDVSFMKEHFDGCDKKTIAQIEFFFSEGLHEE